MTEILPPTQDGVEQAAALLRAGELVAFGTETVYGLGADATNAEAVARIFEAKGRPRFNPLICHYPDAEAAFAHVVAGAQARLLAEKWMPGPLTLVLRRRTECPVALLTGAGLDTLAVRVPLHPVALALLQMVGRPIAAPSANLSGQVSPTTIEHVLDGLKGQIAAVLDSGPCRQGLESTVLDLSRRWPVVLRPGALATEELRQMLGRVDAGETPGAAPRAPGMLASHYAPRLPVRLEAISAGPDEALLAFGPPLPGAGAVFQLSERGDVLEAASRLFAGLRWLDSEGRRLGLRGIAAMPVPDEQLGHAINDRLRRAAAPRG